MNAIKEFIDKIINPVKPLPPGVYHYQAPEDAPFLYRLHLRLEPDGQGTLIVNASTVLHLNETAAEYAYHLIHQTPEDGMVDEMLKRYQVQSDQIRQDYHTLIERLQTLIETPDLDPVTFLDFEREEPYERKITAPYRLDCAITYSVVTPGKEDSAPQDRVKRELSTEEWKTILKKAWGAGIPHIIFTGGEPTLRSDLVELINHAEDLGQVTGVLTNGLRLADTDYLQQLLLSGLDHIMIVMDPENDLAWEALETVMPEDIFTAVHLTITKENAAMMDETLERLANLDVSAISLSEADIDLTDTLQAIRDKAARLDMTLIWDVPVPYSRSNPVSLELAENDKSRRGEGKAWLYVEPDGDVLKAQGMPEVLGNILGEPWEEIWAKAGN